MMPSRCVSSLRDTRFNSRSVASGFVGALFVQREHIVEQAGAMLSPLAVLPADWTPNREPDAEAHLIGSGRGEEVVVDLAPRVQRASWRSRARARCQEIEPLPRIFTTDARNAA